MVTIKTCHMCGPVSVERQKGIFPVSIVRNGSEELTQEVCYACFLAVISALMHGVSKDEQGNTILNGRRPLLHN